MELRDKVHLKGAGELCRSPKREVHVLVKHLRDVRTRHLHPLGEIRLRQPQLLHPQEDSPQERGADLINGRHLTKRSRPVEYAAEYFTFGLFALLPSDQSIVSQSFKYVF